jgi:transposase
MSGRVGCPARIITRLPGQRELARVGAPALSEKAKRRLEVLDWYFKKPLRFSKNKKPNAALTCRHFGIHRSRFYRWKARYNPRRLESLEPGSTAPKRKRQPEYTRALVEKVRAIRKEDQTCSGKKIRPILLRSMAEAEVPSVSTLGRLIKRENLFFRPDTKLHRKRSKSARKAHERKRKPAGLKAAGPNHRHACRVIEYDMKHIYLLGNKLYAFAAIDPYKSETKFPRTRCSASPQLLPASTARPCLKKWSPAAARASRSSTTTAAKTWGKPRRFWLRRR